MNAMTPPVILSEHHESILADALYLLSRSATVGVCRGRMRAVINRLKSLVEEEAFPPMLRAMAERLLVEWHEAQIREFGGKGSGHDEHAEEDAMEAAHACHCQH
jgi:hypothetical protein